MTPKFFASQSKLRAWFREHHERLEEQWVGYYKKSSGIESVDWAESVDVALCFGWIDGLRKRIDDLRYMVRFTPRRPGSHWSARNVERMQALIAEGSADEAGLSAYRARDPSKVYPRAAQRKPAALPSAYRGRLAANPQAWRDFQSRPPWYRRQVALWVTSAKREETRLRRLEVLIASSAEGKVIPPLRWSGRK